MDRSELIETMHDAADLLSFGKHYWFHIVQDRLGERRRMGLAL